MPRRSVRFYGVSKLKGLGKTRHVKKVAQPPFRPFVLKARDAIKRELLRIRRDGFVLHRRGPKREDLAGDPREQRAVPKSQVRGTLPERVYYKKNLDYRMSPVYDFDFQSSLDGGRSELGGIVADFIYPRLLVVVRIQGPTHEQYGQKRRDEDQRRLLGEMGYKAVYDLNEKQIYDETYLDWFMRTHIRLAANFGSTSVSTIGGPGDAYNDEAHIASLIFRALADLERALSGL